MKLSAADLTFLATWHRNLEKHKGTMKAISKKRGVDPSLISKGVNPNRDDSGTAVPNALWIHDTVELTGDFAVLDAMEERLGRVAIPLPKKMPHEENLLIQLAVVMDEGGDVARTLRKAVSKDSEGGREITPNELNEIISEGLELAGATAVLIGMLRKKLEEKKAE